MRYNKKEGRDTSGPYSHIGEHHGEKKTFSTMEIVLLIFLIGSLILSYLQARRQENERE